jgi:hypothetical protein
MKYDQNILHREDLLLREKTTRAFSHLDISLPTPTTSLKEVKD